MTELNIFLLVFAVSEFFVGTGIVLYLIPKAKAIDELNKSISELTRELGKFKEEIHKDYVGEQLFEKRVKSIAWDIAKEHCRDCPNHKKLQSIGI